jgi:hypothetical protein
MLIKHKVIKSEPTSKKFLFIELNVEDFRGKNSVYKRVNSIAKECEGAKRANVFRIKRTNITPAHLDKLMYLDRLSTKYKQCLLKHNFNYAYRQFDSNYRGHRAFKAV